MVLVEPRDSLELSCLFDIRVSSWPQCRVGVVFTSWTWAAVTQVEASVCLCLPWEASSSPWPTGQSTFPTGTGSSGVKGHRGFSLLFSGRKGSDGVISTEWS